MNRMLEPVQNGSNYPFREKMLSPNAKRSAFDWSHNLIFSMSNAGVLMPVFLSEVLPNSDYSISADVLLRVLPQVVPLYSEQRYYLQAFYARYSDLWNDASVYITKGFSGNEVLTKPVLNVNNLDPSLVSSGSVLDYVVKAGDLFNCFGLPIGKKIRDFQSINALPFMMYENIYVNYFMNKNLHINDRCRLPNDMSELRLKDDGSIISNANSTVSGGTDKIYFGKLHYRDYPQDYFTSALPFQQRGDAPSLSFNGSSSSFSADALFDSLSASVPVNSSPALYEFVNSSFGVLGNLSPLNNNNVTLAKLNSPSAPLNKRYGVVGDSLSSPSYKVLNSLVGFSGLVDSDFGANSRTSYKLNSPSGSATFSNVTGLTFSGGFTLDEFRNLAIAQQELERMARTDGSFFEFGLTFFGQASRNAIDYKSTFFGGTYQKIAFSEVVQTSQSSSSPLGTYAGHGIMSSSSNLGNVHTDEHGYIMVLLSVMPDVYYTQGINKTFTRLTQSEEFLPGRDKLGLTPIFNKELYVSGVANTDNDLFAYQNPFDDYRYKENRIIGKIADSSNNSFYPYTQSRKFTSTPTYSESFFVANNVRKDYLAAPSEDAYTGKIRFGIRAVEPLSFTGTPAPVV